MSAQSSIAVIILTRNECAHLERLLSNLKLLGCQIYVVDSFSTDATVALAQAGGAVVKQHAFVNYAQQFQWALDNLPIETEWVMRLDADELLTSELIVEIGQKLSKLPLDVTGINLKRRHIFMGQWIRHGGRYPLVLLRIWRKGAAKIEQRWMDEHMVLLRGHSVTFDRDFCELVESNRHERIPN